MPFVLSGTPNKRKAERFQHPFSVSAPDAEFILPTSADDVYSFLQALSASPATDTPTEGDTLTINGESLGSFDYHVVKEDTVVSSFDSDDWFTTDEDSKSAFIVVDGDLTINSGQVFKPSKRKLFAAIYVTGTLTVEGEISMSARGADHSAATGSNVTAVAIKIAPDGTYGAVTDPVVPAAGGSGGAQVSVSTPTNGNAGSAGASGGTGGGGSGSKAEDMSGVGGAGAAGTSFSGGSGGGAGARIGTGSAGASDGGPGGDGDNAGLSNRGAGGGAGNPGGSGAATPGATAEDGGDGTGGTLFVFVEGSLTGTGAVTAAGSAGGDSGGTGSPQGGGGGSGGGHVTVMYGSDSSSITPAASGGAGGDGDQVDGGAGGAGTARKIPITAS